jgi:hypothetical protein
MIELPGSFSGSLSSPRPQRGPDPSRRISLAILESATASVFNRPEKSTDVSWLASASNLFGAVSNGRPVISAISAAIASTETLGRVQPGAHRRAALRKLAQAMLDQRHQPRARQRTCA